MDYIADLPDGGEVTVSNLRVEVCDDCGEIALDSAATAQVQAAIVDYNDLLSPKELEHIRKSFEVTQGQMSDILGLGSKTYHRWENGVQYPSRSMGYYLRVLHEYPQAFAWLKNRKWKIMEINRVKLNDIDTDALFPSLKSRGYCYEPINEECQEVPHPALALFNIQSR